MLTPAPRSMSRIAVIAAALVATLMQLPPAFAADDAYRPPSDDTVVRGEGGSDSYSPPPPQGETYEPEAGAPRAPRRNNDVGEPYSPGPGPSSGGRASKDEYYEQLPPSADNGGDDSISRGYYSQNEILKAGHGFFGSVSGGLASAIEWAFQKSGRPNGYILGEDAGGALVAGLRYGEGRLHTKDAGEHRVYWQGPSVGYDFGGEGSKVMVLVYNMREPDDIYERFGGVQGAAYLVGGVSVQLQQYKHVTLAPIRAGVGLRLGANVGYLKYTRRPTWNPF